MAVVKDIYRRDLTSVILLALLELNYTRTPKYEVQKMILPTVLKYITQITGASGQNIYLLWGLATAVNFDIIKIPDTWMDLYNTHLNRIRKTVDGCDFFDVDKQHKWRRGVALFITDAMKCYKKWANRYYCWISLDRNRKFEDKILLAALYHLPKASEGVTSSLFLRNRQSLQTQEMIFYGRSHLQ